MYYAKTFHIEDEDGLFDFMNEEGLKFVCMEHVGDKRVTVVMSDSKKPPPKPSPEPAEQPDAASPDAASPDGTNPENAGEASTPAPDGGQPG